MTDDIHANPPVKSILDVPYTKLSSDQIDRFQLAISLVNQNPSPDLTPESLKISITTALKNIKLSSSTANRCLALNLALKLLQWDEFHDLSEILPFIETFEIPTNGIPSTQQTAWVHLGHFLSRQLNTINSEIHLASTPNALIQQLPAFEHLPLNKISLREFNHNWRNLEKIFIEMNWRQLWERGILQRKHLYALAKRTQHSTLQERYLLDQLYLSTRPSLQQIRRWECDLNIPRTLREPPSLLKLIELYLREHSPLIDTELGHSKISEYLTQHTTLKWKDLELLIGLGSENGRWYMSRQIPKKIRKSNIISYHRDGNIQSKRMRRLNIPNPVLKRIQSIILKCLEPVFPSNEYSTGFTRNQSVVTHALYHSGATAAVKMDIHSFFLSTGFSHLPSNFEATLSKHFSDQDLFTKLIPLCYYISKIKREPNKEMTHWNFLSEGAPTSPFFSNLSASEMDDLLGRITKTLRFNYSRYADDLVISTNESIPRVGFQNVAQNILSFAIQTGGRMNTIREVCPNFEEYLLSFYDLWGFFSDGRAPQLDTVNFKSVLLKIQRLEASTPTGSLTGWKAAREKTHVWHHQHGRPLCICGIVVPSHKSDPLSLPKEYRREIRAILHRLKTKPLASSKEKEEKVKLSNHGKLAYAAHVYGTSHLLPLVKPFFARQLEQCLQSIVPMRAIPFIQQGWIEGIKKTKG